MSNPSMSILARGGESSQKVAFLKTVWDREERSVCKRATDDPVRLLLVAQMGSSMRKKEMAEFERTQRRDSGVLRDSGLGITGGKLARAKRHGDKPAARALVEAIAPLTVRADRFSDHDGKDDVLFTPGGLPHLYHCAQQAKPSGDPSLTAIRSPRDPSFVHAERLIKRRAELEAELTAANGELDERQTRVDDMLQQHVHKKRNKTQLSADGPSPRQVLQTRLVDKVEATRYHPQRSIATDTQVVVGESFNWASANSTAYGALCAGTSAAPGSACAPGR